MQNVNAPATIHIVLKISSLKAFDRNRKGSGQKNFLKVHSRTQYLKSIQLKQIYFWIGRLNLQIFDLPSECNCFGLLEKLLHANIHICTLYFTFPKLREFYLQPEIYGLQMIPISIKYNLFAVAIYIASRVFSVLFRDLLKISTFNASSIQ